MLLDMPWEKYKKHHFHDPELGFSLDISKMNFPDSFFQLMEERMVTAFREMEALESGAIANPDENRMVGHYWLRNPEMAPSPEIREAIENALKKILRFTEDIHAGNIVGQGGPFRNVLLIGIGGSALGPQFVGQALGDFSSDKLKMFFFDNTDPDGFDQILGALGNQLNETLAVVVSKSGSTPETRNGMVEAKNAYQNASLEFERHAVAITDEDSHLDRLATENGWLERFPLWDWVGGRTSETGAVGLLPAALQGIDINGFLDGARAMDEVTRRPQTARNPAALLALMWYHATDGKGSKDMVVLPYKDRLSLFPKYLQQLVMESLGKARDLRGNLVNQGIAVYGNKGSTDQHAYVQQLRDGVANFFATFIEVLKDRNGDSMEVEPGNTSGDFLNGFFLGTRAALHENGRESITITLDEVNPASVGMLIALFERAVGYYASLVGINAYHQPGVEAGKKAAASFLQLKELILKFLQNHPNQTYTAETLAKSLSRQEDTELIFKLLEHSAANPSSGIYKSAEDIIFENGYGFDADSNSH